MRTRIAFPMMVLLFGLCCNQVLAQEKPLRVGVVLSVGGLGDKSFNDAAYAGIQKLRRSSNCSVDVVEPSDVTSIEPDLEFLASRNLDVVIAVGLFANDAVRKVAGRYPNLKFALLDSVVTAPNVISVIFNEEEGSFYAGALAGLLTKTSKVGFLGGMSSPVIASFERGFKNGLHFVNPEASFISRYAGDSPDAFGLPEVGKKIGMEIAAEGADIIYHAAGGTGLGLIEASRRGKYLVIGVDSDQATIVPGKVAASMVKRLDVALDRIIKTVREGRFAGSVLTLGLADSGVELVISKFNKNLITPVVYERLRDIETFLLHQTSRQ